jgi:hypothetical protein
MKPKAQIIGLNTLSLRATSPTLLDTPQRALKRRVFTEDEWNFLNTRPTKELHYRIYKGDLLIDLLNRPEMMNMASQKAAEITSNLRYQQDAIREIIESRLR